jgi:hypothetical protein
LAFRDDGAQVLRADADLFRRIFRQFVDDVLRQSLAHVKQRALARLPRRVTVGHEIAPGRELTAEFLFDEFLLLGNAFEQRCCCDSSTLALA